MLYAGRLSSTVARSLKKMIGMLEKKSSSGQVGGKLADLGWSDGGGIDVATELNYSPTVKLVEFDCVMYWKWQVELAASP
ncbi:hypothetical protein V6N13_125946 [Hibiscus sabdariffa]